MNIGRRLFDGSKHKRRIRGIYGTKLYYIILIVCIIVVGASAATVTVLNLNRVKFKENADRLISEEQIGENNGVSARGTELLAEVPTVQPDQGSTAGTEKASGQKPGSENTGNTGAQNKATSAAEKTPVSASGSKPAQNKAANRSPILSRPVLGSIVVGYAMDKLVFSNTLDEWTTHSGIDIACSRGTPVKAAADGTVREIKNDPRYGVTIIIEHADGLKTVYANLAGGDMVQPNQKVKAGDVIGGVGSTALFESQTEPHLHFEVLKNDEPVDPMKYLP